MKIIGGKVTEWLTGVRLCVKLLWPCYEVIAYGRNIDVSSSENVIERVILELAAAGLQDCHEIADALCLAPDLVEFAQERLLVKGLLDEGRKITSNGQAKLDEDAQKTDTSIYLYVDAIGGKLLDYYSPISVNNSINLKDMHSEDGIWYFKESASAGTESDEPMKARQLRYTQKRDCILDIDRDEPTKMLCRLLNKKDANATFDTDNLQYGDSKDNGNKKIRAKLVHVLCDACILDGNRGEWLFTDGFGGLSRVFSNENLDDVDADYLTEDRKSVIVDIVETHDKEKDLPKTNTSFQDYPELQEKAIAIQKALAIIGEQVDSTDNDNRKHKAERDFSKNIAQFIEWVIYYSLHKSGRNERLATLALKDTAKFGGLQKNKHSAKIVGTCALEAARSLGFDVAGIEDLFFKPFGAIFHAYKDVPNLFCLVDLFLVAFAECADFKAFAKRNASLLCSLAAIKDARDTAMHLGSAVNDKTADEFVSKGYAKYTDDFFKSATETAQVVFKYFLGVSYSFKQDISTAIERISSDTAQDKGVVLLEKDLGFKLCKLLNRGLFYLVLDMECCVSPAKVEGSAPSVDNAIVLEQCRVLENLFMLVIKSTYHEGSTDWKDRATKLGFNLGSIDNPIFKTRSSLVEAAINGDNSSLGATVIAFFSVVDMKQLRIIASCWNDLLVDTGYLIELRGHGEVPTKIDSERSLAIKEKIITLIKTLADSGYLLA